MARDEARMIHLQLVFHEHQMRQNEDDNLNDLTFEKALALHEAEFVYVASPSPPRPAQQVSQPTRSSRVLDLSFFNEAQENLFYELRDMLALIDFECTHWQCVEALIESNFNAKDALAELEFYKDVSST